MNGVAAAPTSLPGLHSPAVGFEQPFEMLHACHDRVQRMLGLLQRLRAYLQERPCDDVARQAARDVMRYFDQAAPLHHEDEELHVFPPLLAQGSPELVALVRQLQRDHVCMAADWADLTPAWAAGQSLPPHLAGRVPGGKLVATVDPEPARPGVKRVTVTVTWTDPGGRPARPVALTALFASRTRIEP